MPKMIGLYQCDAKSRLLWLDQHGVRESWVFHTKRSDGGYLDVEIRMNFFPEEPQQLIWLDSLAEYKTDD